MIEQFLNIVNGARLTAITLSIVIDFLLGVIVAIKKGEFSFQKLAQFVNTNILFYLGGYFCVGVIALANPQFVPLVTLTFALIEVTLASSILAKLRELGLPVPEELTK